MKSSLVGQNDLWNAIQSLSDGLMIVDRDNQITFMNSAAERITGWSLADARGKPSGIVFHTLDACTGKASWQPVLPTIRENRPYTLLPNTVLVRRDATKLPVEDVANPIHNDKGEVSGAVVLFRDITENYKLLKEVLNRVHHDPLTGLPNRTLLEEHLELRKPSGPSTSPIALLCLDLDNFKKINDTYGHPAGDFVLKSAAARLRMAVPEGSLVCRYGGDEFVVLLEDEHSMTFLQARTESLLKALREPLSFSGTQLFITASLGGAIRSAENPDDEDLLTRADRAMYCSKRAGGNRGTIGSTAF